MKEKVRMFGSWLIAAALALGVQTAVAATKADDEYRGYVSLNVATVSKGLGKISLQINWQTDDAMQNDAIWKDSDKWGSGYDHWEAGQYVDGSGKRPIEFFVYAKPADADCVFDGFYLDDACLHPLSEDASIIVDCIGTNGVIGPQSGNLANCKTKLLTATTYKPVEATMYAVNVPTKDVYLVETGALEPTKIYAKFVKTASPAGRVIEVSTTAEAQAALDAAKEGDTIVLAAGTYDKLFLRQTKENSTRESSLDNGGSYPAYYREFKGITIKAADDAAVTVKGITAEAGLFWHSSAPASNQADMNPTAGFHSYLDIENLAIKGITFDVSENSGVVLRDNVISGHEGLYVDGLAIDGCSTVNGDETNTGIHFLTAGAGTTDNTFFTTEKKGINNVTVSNCTISNVFQPISFNNSTALLNNLTVTGNTFTDCGYSNILMLSNKANTGTFTITGNTVNRIVARFIRSTNASADWTITGNTLVDPLQYEEESGTDVVKITGVPTTATITSTDNSWGEGSLVNGTWIANGDKTKLVAVAEIVVGKVHHVYATLQEAFDAAGDGDTVVLLVDVTSAMNEAYTVAKGKSITFDLNGKVLSGGNDKATGFAYLTNNGTLTLKDSSAEGTGKITSKTYPDTGNCAGFHTVLNKGTFVMESGTIEEASVKVGGGVNLKWAFRNEASANQTVVATIRGGTIVANYNAVSDYVYDDSSDCTLNIEGGVIKSTGRFSAVTLQDAGSSKPKFRVNISGGEFIVENKINTNADGNAIFYCDAQGNANADFTGCFTITGGKFNTFNTPMIAEFTADAGTPVADTKFMTAGLSKCVIPQESIADGYVCVGNPDEATKEAYPWKVQEPTVTTEDDAPIVIDIDPTAHEGAGETVPVVVTQDLAKEILGEEVAKLTPEQAATVVEKLEKKGEDGMTGWQKYTAGFKQTDQHPLAPKGKSAEDGKLVLVTSLVQPKQLSVDTGVKVKYILKKATTVNPATGVPDDAAFEPVQELDSPEFPVDVTELPPETYWKIDVEYTATKTVEVKVEDIAK